MLLGGTMGAGPTGGALYNQGDEILLEVGATSMSLSLSGSGSL